MRNRAVWRLLLVPVAFGAAGVLGVAGVASESPAETPVATAPEGVAAGAGPEVEPAAGLVRRDEANKVEIVLPAPYWRFYPRSELADMGRGGCGGRPELPPELICAVGHNDAPCVVQCARRPGSYLMRSREDLEAFVEERLAAIKKQLGDRMEIVEPSTYSEVAGATVHRVAFSVPAGGGAGGCAPAAAAEGDGNKMVNLLVNYFMRPVGQDALHYEVNCVAPEAVFEKLKPEVDFIVSHFRYAGETVPAAEFYVPDAPEEKLLTAEDAREDVTPRRRGSPLTFVMLAAVLVWMLWRRRGRAKAA